MRNKLLVFAIFAAVLFLLGYFAYRNFEIYPRKLPVDPSRAVLANKYYALEKWLARTGHPVRVEKTGNASVVISSFEKTVIILSSAFDWKNAVEILVPWVEEGGSLVIAIDENSEDIKGSEAFLEILGIKSLNYWDRFEEEEQEEENKEEEPEPEPEPEEDVAALLVPVPYFGWDTYFECTNDDPALIITSPAEVIRLVKLNVGKGTVTVIGEPIFMYNNFLEEGELNARLAWDLTGAAASGDNTGVLFIRGKKTVKSLFGKVADRGNIVPLGISALILIVVGFWMVVPSFGLLLSDDARLNGYGSIRSIRERFLSETRFLKKYHALEKYLEIYLREIKIKLKGRESEPEIEAIENVLKKGKGLRYKDIIRSLKICQNIMERL